jgi:hypothetical protein
MDIERENEMNRYEKIVDRVAMRVIAATKDLASILQIAPEWYEKRAQLQREQEFAQQEFNRRWVEAHTELEKRTTELLSEIKKALVQYFNQSGKGVRSEDQSGGLVEVFIGSKDGIKRTQSKVSVHIHTAFEDRTSAKYKLRSESLEDVDVDLSKKNTIPMLIKAVKKADENGFWDLADE